MNATHASRPRGLLVAGVGTPAAPRPGAPLRCSPGCARRRQVHATPGWRGRGLSAVRAAADTARAARRPAPSPEPPRLLCDFDGAFQEELGELERLQAAALAADAGAPRLGPAPFLGTARC
jgi:hypothetical protein